MIALALPGFRRVEKCLFLLFIMFWTAPQQQTRAPLEDPTLACLLCVELSPPPIALLLPNR
jgi:hypothetical protein